MVQLIRKITLASITAICSFSVFGQGATGAIAPSLSSNSGNLVSRQPDANGWTDPALNHNRLLQQQTGEGMYKLIGPYKVIGSSFLFGPRNKADMYAVEAKAFNIYVSYNTYNQEIEFYSTSNPDKPLVKEPGTVDSFVIHTNVDAGIMSELKFIYGSSLGVKDKFYFQELFKGAKYSLYKRYKSDLTYASGDYASPDLRQFDMEVEYYYADASAKGLKKIKPNAGSVTKEFKSVKDLSSVVNADAFTINPEEAFKKAFTAINE